MKKIISSHSSSTGFLVQVIPELVSCDVDPEDIAATSSRYMLVIMAEIWWSLVGVNNACPIGGAALIALELNGPCFFILICLVWCCG